METKEKAAELPETEASDGSTSIPNPTVGRIAMAALFLLFVTVIYLSYSMGVGSPANPGPGLWPMTVGVLGAALSLILVIKGSSWLPSESGTYRWTLIIALTICGYMILLPVLGFVVTTAILCFVVTRIIGQSGWVTSIATTILAPVLAYIVFNQLLGVPPIESSLF